MVQKYQYFAKLQASVIFKCKGANLTGVVGHILYTFQQKIRNLMFTEGEKGKQKKNDFPLLYFNSFLTCFTNQYVFKDKNKNCNKNKKNYNYPEYHGQMSKKTIHIWVLMCSVGPFSLN